MHVCTLYGQKCVDTLTLHPLVIFEDFIPKALHSPGKALQQVLEQWQGLTLKAAGWG